MTLVMAFNFYKHEKYNATSGSMVRRPNGTGRGCPWNSSADNGFLY
jgi:hypothetical protein